MVVFDGHESYLSIQFEQFYKEKCIIIFYLPIHFSHLIQPLDVGCFNILKRLYNQSFENFIKTYINHIIKTEFFIAFKITHFNTMTSENIKASFRNVNLMPYDLQAIISKLDVKLQILTPINPPLLNVDP